MRALVLALLLFLAASWQAYAEPRDHTGFTRVDATGALQVEVTLGSSHSVDVSGAGASGVQTRMRGDVLVVTWAPPGGVTSAGVVVRVTTPQLEGARAINGAHVSVAGLADGDVTLQAASAGELTVSGRCRTLLAVAASSGDIDARALTCEDGRVRASSGAEVRVTVARWVEVAASSGADVFSLGTPRYGPVAVSSGGTLHRGLREGG